MTLRKVKIINAVAVRMKSRRLPGKALLPLCGKAVLWHLIDRVGRAKVPDQTVICTSQLKGDDKIEEFARKNNFAVFRGHPDNVLLRFIEAAEVHGADHVVRITGDNPLTDPDLIDEMCRLHDKEAADYTYTNEPPRGTRPEVISVSALKKCNRLAENPNFSEYMTLYFKNHPTVFKNVEYACGIPEYYRPNYRVTIDTTADFEVVEMIYDKLYKMNKTFSLSDIIAFLDTHSEIDHNGRRKTAIDVSQINTKLKVN